MKVSLLMVVLGFIPMIPSTTSYTAPVEPFHTVQAIVTAYTSSPDETDDTPNITASGTRTSMTTIACPSKLDFGTEVEVAGRRYTCADRMHPRFRDREVYDIWLPTKHEARQWGKQHLSIKVFE